MARPGDRDLGMDRPINRRDFLHGAGVAVAGGWLAGQAHAGATPLPTGADPSLYPPLRTGSRGSHPGSYEVAHRMAFQGVSDWGEVVERDHDVYDLVVVGAGISGLAAAWFYRKQHPDARILLLENHDDFGGHAKRNEFRIDGHTLIGYGGSQSLENPGSYSDVSKQLLIDLGVDTDRFYQAYDRGFYRRHGLAPALFFDRKSYGVDRLVRSDLLDASSRFMQLAKVDVPAKDVAEQLPISPEARADFLRLVTMTKDHLPDHSIFAEPELLSTISYRDFVVRYLGIDNEEVLGIFQNLPTGYWGLGIDAIPAIGALMMGLPGIEATSLGRVNELAAWAVGLFQEPYIFHFPDGNAGVARLLVRSLMPDVAPGSSMEDIVTAPFDYARLDDPAAPVRLRLNSTVVRARHDGASDKAGEVVLSYVRGGRTGQVRARHCVLACYNAAIPYLCPELPEPQKLALSEAVRAPLVYTTALLRNWRAFQQLGLAMALCPGTYHTMAMLDFPVSLGDYAHAKTPDDPILVHLSAVPTKPGLPAREQHRAGRAEMLALSFETLERGVREQLGGMLAGGGFDPAFDIEALTINRWAHGYAWDTENPLWNSPEERENPTHVRARQRFGRISIANSDAGGLAYLDCAIDEAHRAVAELS